MLSRRDGRYDGAPGSTHPSAYLATLTGVSSSCFQWVQGKQVVVLTLDDFLGVAGRSTIQPPM